MGSTALGAPAPAWRAAGSVAAEAGTHHERGPHVRGAGVRGPVVARRRAPDCEALGAFDLRPPARGALRGPTKAGGRVRGDRKRPPPALPPPPRGRQGGRCARPGAPPGRPPQGPPSGPGSSVPLRLLPRRRDGGPGPSASRAPTRPPDAAPQGLVRGEEPESRRPDPAALGRGWGQARSPGPGHPRAEPTSPSSPAASPPPTRSWNQ